MELLGYSSIKKEPQGFFLAPSTNEMQKNVQTPLAYKEFPVGGSSNDQND